MINGKELIEKRDKKKLRNRNIIMNARRTIKRVGGIVNSRKKTITCTHYLPEFKKLIDLGFELIIKNLDLSKITNIEFDGVDHDDSPDYCDAYISSAKYDNIDLSSTQLDIINNDREFIHNQLLNYLY